MYLYFVLEKKKERPKQMELIWYGHCTTPLLLSPDYAGC